MIQIRKANPSDANAIHEIETLCIKNPWSIKLIQADLNSNPNASYWVAVCNGLPRCARNDSDAAIQCHCEERSDAAICGFIGTHNISGEINITNVAVHPNFRRQGLANQLMKTMIDYFEKNCEDLIGITLEVRISNRPAIKLYERFGFKSEGIRKSYYQDGEDAMIMWKRY